MTKTLLRFLPLAGLLLTAGCSLVDGGFTRESAPVMGAALPGGDPRIVKASAPLQCVPYARELSGIQIRGDAWTWWHTADGRYRRGARPEVGAVLVLARTSRLRGGHLAVVTEVLNGREIVVRHANWLNRGRIHLDTPVRDVSAANDWSAVRVWYTPGQTWGARRYAVAGFVSPQRL